MKNSFTLLLIFCSLSAFAQSQSLPPGVNIANTSKLPVYFVDSVKLADSYLYYIAPNDIAGINIKKDAQYPQGEVDVTLKDHNLLLTLLKSPMLSLNDMVNSYVPEDQKKHPLLFTLNGKLVTDTAELRIPAICINKVTLAKAAELPYFKTAMPDILLMMISTGAISAKPSQPGIMIKGLATNQ